MIRAALILSCIAVTFLVLTIVSVLGTMIYGMGGMWSMCFLTSMVGSFATSTMANVLAEIVRGRRDA